MIKSIGFYRAERIQWFCKIFRITDSHRRQFLRSQMLFRHAQDIGFGYRGDGLLVLINEILGITDSTRK
jgi:hypothetical protein